MVMIPPLRHEERDRLVDELDRAGPAMTLVASVVECRVPAAKDAASEAMCFDRQPVPFEVLSDQEGNLFFAYRSLNRSVDLHLGQRGCCVFATLLWQPVQHACFPIKDRDEAMPLFIKIPWHV